jgi:hypothetical protein
LAERLAAGGISHIIALYSRQTPRAPDALKSGAIPAEQTRPPGILMWKQP